MVEAKLGPNSTFAVLPNARHQVGNWPLLLLLTAPALQAAPLPLHCKQHTPHCKGNLFCRLLFPSCSVIGAQRR